MVGRQEIIIGAEEFVRGMSTNKYTNDGGFSPLNTSGVNIIGEPGIYRSPAPRTNISQSVGSALVASTSDDQLTAPIDKFILGVPRATITDGNGVFYSFNGTTLTTVATDSTNKYSIGFSDIVAYKGNRWVTARGKVRVWSGTDTFADHGDSDLTSLTPTVPHPMLIYETFVYVANGNVLVRASGTDSGDAVVILTLETGAVITALGIEPSTGYMLIGVTQGQNASGTRDTRNRMLTYDGFSNKALRSINVTGMVTAFATSEGATYVAYGKSIGVWNGSGISFLRSLDITYNIEDLTYKHKMFTKDNTLYVVERGRVLAYGDILPGQKGFYYPVSVQLFTTRLQVAFPIDRDKIAFAFFFTGDDDFAEMIDVRDTANSGSITLQSRKYRFNRPTFLRKVKVFLTEDMQDNVNETLTVSIIDDKGTTVQLGQVLGNSADKPIRSFEVPAQNLELQAFQVTVSWVAAASDRARGIEYIAVEYDTAQ